MNNIINDLSKTYYEKSIQDRRWFHENAELSNQEYNTTEYIINSLKELNIPYYTPTPTGVIAVINSNNSGKVIAIRGDIDALPIEELADVPYKSKNSGIMHACGHDLHTASILTTARMLNDIKDSFSGTVKLIFQPAEEYFPSGARAMLDSGLLSDVNAFVGVHVWTDIDVGKFSIEKGPRMAASMSINIDVHGKGGHGGLPHLTVDSILVGSAIIMNLQSFVSRGLDPNQTAVVSIGTFNSGSARNIISNTAHMEGTIRYYDESIVSNMKASIERIVYSTAEAYGAKATVEFIPGLTPVINDDNLSKIADKVCTSLYEDNSVVLVEKSPGCDDFCYYREQAPSLYAFVGGKDITQPINYPLHNPHCVIDENAVINASEFLTGMCVEYLNNVENYK